MNEITTDMIDDYVAYLREYEPNEYEAIMREEAEVEREWQEFNSHK